MDYDMDDWRMILATFALIICMLWDVSLEVVKDYLKVKIRPWIPTNLFVLSALTIQILGYVQIQKVSVFGPSNEEALEVLVRKQLGMDAARLTMCVFVGCLLPEMAIAGTQGRWTNVAALFLSFSFHIATEIYALQNASNSIVESEAGPWFISSGALLLVGASSLLLLLGAAILSGKLERDHVRHHLSKTFSRDVENEGDRWETLGKVMESLVGSRVWKTSYYCLSLRFTPGAAMIVTVCVAVMAAKVACRSSLLRHNNGGGNLTFFLQCIFILLGWILVLYRWFKAVLYCSMSAEQTNFIKASRAARYLFSVPVAVVVNLISPRLAYFLLHPIFSLKNILISVCCLVPLLHFYVLILVIGLLWSVCFTCRYLSVKVLGSQFVQSLCKLDKKSVLSSDEYFKYQSILDDMGFGDEDFQHVFWKVNKGSYEKIISRMDDCKLRQSRTGLLSIMGNGKLAPNQRLQSIDNCWMFTILSIFDSVADLEIGVDMGNAFTAYRETVDVLKFVEYPDNIVVDPLNSFGTLNFFYFVDTIDCEGKMREVEKKLKRALGTEERGGVERELTTEERERVDKMLREFSDKLKPSNERASNSLLMRLAECSYYNREELGELLRTLVGHVIVSGLLEASDQILKCTRQWAMNIDEKKIERAIELAGMVTVLLENVVEEGDILFNMV